ncbi:MAG TPA: RraA family protein [Chthonomonadaceae bacterium]|nr:RraA family protein [Chthonomonadaceae bacterium]
MIPEEDAALFEWVAAHLYTAVLSDSCDALGCRQQALGPEIRPVEESLTLVGRAKTVLWSDAYHIPDNPYEGEIRAVDSIRPGDVVVMATGASTRNAPWGELMSTACVQRGGRGAVTDGLIRDVRRIRALGLPVFAAGYKPVDSRGRGLVIAHDVPVEIGGVRIAPGDLVMGDLDGVVVVPRAVEREVLELAYQKTVAENHTREELEQGRLLAEVYAKYGVL